MKRVLSVAFVMSIVLSSFCVMVAQNPPQPKPGPEQKNLQYFVGTWKISGDLKPGPMGPGGKFSGTERAEWMPGGFFLVSHTQGSGAGMGNVTGLQVFGYEAEKKQYTFSEFSSNGEEIHATGQFDGKVWTWSSDFSMGGKAMKSHFILTENSPTAYGFKLEVSEDGNNWATVEEGTGTKAAGVAKTTKKK